MKINDVIFSHIKDRRLEPDTQIRQAQMVMLNLLYHFDALCKKHNLTYWLEGGTLLGAVRHKGFIPWDDDVDVMMPQNDYDTFLHLDKSEFPKHIYHDTRIEFQRLRDRYSKRLELDEAVDSDKNFNSIYIDIFPAKKYPYMRKVLCRIRMLIPPYTPPAIKNAPNFNNKIKRICANILYYFFTFTGIQFIIKGLCLIGPKKYWSYNLARTWHFHFNDEWIFPLITLPFEDGFFPVPRDYQTLLTYQFGDYMTPPPDNNRNHHSNKALLVTTPCNHPEALQWNGGKS